MAVHTAWDQIRGSTGWGGCTDTLNKPAQCRRAMVDLISIIDHQLSLLAAVSPPPSLTRQDTALRSAITKLRDDSRSMVRVIDTGGDLAAANQVVTNDMGNDVEQAFSTIDPAWWNSP